MNDTTGCHQGAQKLTEALESALVIEMGARPYVPALGRFLQVDPVESGVDNDYVWPTDLIGKIDLTGKFEVDGMIRSVSMHATEQMVIRGVSATRMLRAIASKSTILQRGPVGRYGLSAEFFGRNSTVTVGNRSRAVTSVMPYPGRDGPVTLVEVSLL